LGINSVSCLGKLGHCYDDDYDDNNNSNYSFISQLTQQTAKENSTVQLNTENQL